MGKYIAIYCDKDGDVSVSVRDREQIVEWLDELGLDELGDDIEFRQTDWEPGAQSGMMIIQGEIVMPGVKTVAWRLP